MTTTELQPIRLAFERGEEVQFSILSSDETWSEWYDEKSEPRWFEEEFIRYRVKPKDEVKEESPFQKARREFMFINSPTTTKEQISWQIGWETATRIQSDQITSLTSQLEAEREKVKRMGWVPCSERMPASDDASCVPDFSNSAVEWTDGKKLWICRHDTPNFNSTYSHPTHWRRIALPSVKAKAWVPRFKVGDRVRGKWDGKIRIITREIASPNEQCGVCIEGNKWGTSSVFESELEPYTEPLPPLERMPLEAGDVCPGSVFRLAHWETGCHRCYAGIEKSGIRWNEGTLDSFEQLNKDGWLIKRPNEDWMPCSKPKP